MSKIKIVTIIGTRPEIIRLSATMVSLDRLSSVDHVVIHTGQNYDYELNEIFFEDLNLRKPDYFLNAGGATAIETIGQILINIEKVFNDIEPDAILILGDTNSCLCAIAAKKKKIPIFHLEAGNRCFDQRVPEESNRKIIDHLSDVNLTYSEIAKQNLLKEGLPMDRIFKVGSPMKEVIDYQRNKIENSDILTRLSLVEGKYFVVSSHREENIETANFEKLMDILDSLAKTYDYPIIVSTHPRTRKKVLERGINIDKRVNFIKPLGFIDYISLQTKAFATLSDSGTISEESSILNFPALNLRETHERQEATEEGSVMMVGMNKDRILQGLELLKKQKRGLERDLNIPLDYNVGNVSEKVIRIIISYVDYVNRVVWQK